MEKILSFLFLVYETQKRLAVCKIIHTANLLRMYLCYAEYCLNRWQEYRIQ